MFQQEEVNQQIITTLMGLATLFIWMITRIHLGIRFESYIEDQAIIPPLSRYHPG
jgi:hypothetical protein